MTHSNTMAARRQSGGAFVRRLFLSCLFCACAFGGGAAAADDDDGGAALLRKFWTQTPSARVDFRQRVYDDDGELLSDDGGRFWFARGGKFRVEYHSPDELWLVSDGESFWSYEKDLQQVVVRPLSSLGGGFFAALSAGEWKELPQLYDLSDGGTDDDGLRVVAAQSRDAQDSVRRILFGFDGGGALQKLVMIDAFDGMALVDVNNLSPGADDAVFDFVPPPDAEIISDR